MASAAEARARLERAGFRECAPRAFEANSVFDTPDLRLRREQQLLRLREFAGVATVTWKGPPAPGPHKNREEIETRVEDAAALAALWARLGFEVVFRYEKYRTTFRDAEGRGEAVVDETPIGCFMELEGAAEWIDEKAQQMGFAADEYITESYAALYFGHCERRGESAGHMVFAAEGG